MVAQTPSGGSEQLVIFRRVLIVAGEASLGGLALTAILALAAAFLHEGAFVGAAMLALSATVLANGSVSACRGWLLWRQGAWIGPNGARLSRAEHPRRFAAAVMSDALRVAIHAGLAGFLAIASAAWF